MAAISPKRHQFVLNLQKLDKSLDCPIYFVLGNHDYYRRSLYQVKKDINNLTNSSKKLFFLDTTPTVELSADTALVEYGGWADGRLGDYGNSEVMLNDYVLRVK